MKTPNAVHWKSLPGPEDITRLMLPNGITVLTRSNFNSPSVVISGYLGCGSVFDPPELLGLAHFSASGLMRGTQAYTFQQIFESLESAGASLGLGASVHNTSFGGRALAEDLALLLRVLSEVVRKPVFPPEQIERLRTQFLTGLAIRAQDTADMSSMTFDEVVFPGHPYGIPEDGFTETIQRITRDQIVDFHARHFGPRDMVVVVVGAVTAEQAVLEVENALGDWTNPNQETAPVLAEIHPLQQTVRRHIAIPGKN